MGGHDLFMLPAMIIAMTTAAELGDIAIGVPDEFC